MVLSHRLGQIEPFLTGVVVNELGIPGPIHQRFELAQRLGIGEVLVQNVENKLPADLPVLLILECRQYGAHQWDMLEQLLLEEYSSKLQLCRGSP